MFREILDTNKYHNPRSIPVGIEAVSSVRHFLVTKKDTHGFKSPSVVRILILKVNKAGIYLIVQVFKLFFGLREVVSTPLSQCEYVV